MSLSKAELKEKIIKFSELEDNWDSHGAKPFDEVMINFALSMVDSLPKGEWDVVPGSSGTIEFEETGFRLHDRTIILLSEKI